MIPRTIQYPHQKYQTRYAFSTIELVFVVVVIGILSAVTIGQLTAKKNDAAAVVYQADLALIHKRIEARAIQGLTLNFHEFGLNPTRWTVEDINAPGGVLKSANGCVGITTIPGPDPIIFTVSRVRNPAGLKAGDNVVLLHVNASRSECKELRSLFPPNTPEMEASSGFSPGAYEEIIPYE